MEKQNDNLPEGWTETKISENLFVTYILQEQKDQWRIDRWKKDNINEIIKHQGFTIKSSGRAGTIYYIETDKLCEIDYEISGVKEFDILIYFDSLQNWFSPEKINISISEKEEIKIKLVEWLKFKKIKAEL